MEPHIYFSNENSFLYIQKEDALNFILTIIFFSFKVESLSFVGGLKMVIRRLLIYGKLK